jgi:short subunit dehydrogenase-like uncharacterized protein
MSKQIVVFGATGYTGELVSRALVARGVRPRLAGRNAERLAQLAAQLGGLDTRVADVSRPHTVRALVERGDVLISTVGPFTRWGEPAVEAAIDAGATYLDSTGEPAFIRRVFEQHHRRALEAGNALLTAFGYDWVPGNLAGALALQEAGERAVRVELGYFALGFGISGGTRASIVASSLDASYAFRHGGVTSERAAARARGFDVGGGKTLYGASVGGSEHFGLPADHPHLRDVDVFLGMPGAQQMAAISGVLDAVTRLPFVQKLARAASDRFVQGSTGGPDQAARSKSSCIIIAEAFDAAGQRLSRVRLDGPDPYSFTADILAWAAHTAAEQGVSGAGALGPSTAFGVSGLVSGAAQAGLKRHAQESKA